MMVDLRLILKKEDIQPLFLDSRSGQGLAQGVFLMPKRSEANSETCYALLGDMQ